MSGTAEPTDPFRVERMAEAFQQIETAICDIQLMASLAASTIHNTFGDARVDGADEALFSINQTERMTRDLRAKYYEGWKAP